MVTVQPGDTLDKISKARGTTLYVLKQLNPTVHLLHPGQILRFQKASMRKVITGWRPITPFTIAGAYNIGDPAYVKKLEYALTLIHRRKAAACA